MGSLQRPRLPSFLVALVGAGTLGGCGGPRETVAAALFFTQPINPLYRADFTYGGVWIAGYPANERARWVEARAKMRKDAEARCGESCGSPPKPPEQCMHAEEEGEEERGRDAGPRGVECPLEVDERPDETEDQDADQ